MDMYSYLCEYLDRQLALDIIEPKIDINGFICEIELDRQLEIYDLTAIGLDFESFYSSASDNIIDGKYVFSEYITKYKFSHERDLNDFYYLLWRFGVDTIDFNNCAIIYEKAMSLEVVDFSIKRVYANQAILLPILVHNYKYNLEEYYINKCGTGRDIYSMYAHCSYIDTFKCLEVLEANSLSDCTYIGDLSSFNLRIVKLNSVKSLDSHFFKNCKNLSHLEINSVRKLGVAVFEGCENLKVLYLPSLDKFEYSSFVKNYSLKELYISNDCQYFVNSDIIHFYNRCKIRRLGV